MHGELELDLRAQTPLFRVARWSWDNPRFWEIHVTPEPEPFSIYQPLLQLTANILVRWKYRLYTCEIGGFQVAGFEVENRKNAFAPYEVPLYGLQTVWSSTRKPSEEAYAKLSAALELWESAMTVFSYHWWAKCPLERLRSYMEAVLANELKIAPDFLDAFSRARPDEALVGSLPRDKRYWLRAEV